MKADQLHNIRVKYKDSILSTEIVKFCTNLHTISVYISIALFKQLIASIKKINKI